MPRRNTTDLLQGTLDMLVLKALVWGARHGYEIMRWIRHTSNEELKIEEGALYPALHRMLNRGLIAAEWGVSSNNRRAKFYQLTDVGRRRLDKEAESWNRYVSAVARILEAPA